ncbi:MAG: class I SAM-dependent methyltransferase [Candidatus Methanofastidiosa archaeon]|nr:class I SAM-dependent methyltransferase [Candidatus Methanofastidiosa archaeon]
MEKDRGYESSAEYYDIFASKEHVGFFLRQGMQYERALDIGAGTGLIAIPLASHCKEVYCVEPSAAMHRVLEMKVGINEELMRRVHFIPADAESFKIGRKFPYVFMSGSFEHIMEGDAKRAMHNIASHMEGGAKLLFDAFLGAMRPSSLKMTDKVVDGNYEFRRYIQRRIDGDKVMLKLIYETYLNGELTKSSIQYSQSRAFGLQEVKEVISDAGLSLLAMYSSYDMKPFRGKEPLLIVEASKGQ